MEKELNKFTYLKIIIVFIILLFNSNALAAKKINPQRPPKPSPVLPPPDPAPAPIIRYDLASGPYTITDLGVPFNSAENVGGKVMFQDRQGKLHLVAGLNSTGSGDFTLIHLNVTDNVYYTAKGVTGRRGSLPLSGFAVWHDKLYFVTGYGAKDLYEYNLQGGLTYKQNTGEYAPVGLYLGFNDKLYIGTSAGSVAHCYEYDPATDAFTDLGGVGLRNTETYHGYMGCDGEYLYVVIRQTSDNHFYLGVVNLSDQSKTYWFDEALDKCGTIGATTSGKLQYVRTQADGSKSYWQLANGVPTQWTEQPSTAWRVDSQSRYPIALAGGGNDGEWTRAFNYEWDFGEMVCWDGQPFSLIRYRTPVGSGTWVEKNIDFGSNLPVYPVKPYRILPLTEAPGKVLICGKAYYPMVNYDYYQSVLNIDNVYYPKINYGYSPVETYLGFPQASVYHLLKAPSGYYISGYSGALLRYNPALPWTLSSETFNINGFDPADENKPNPYHTKVRYGSWDYYSTYSVDGMVWTGMEYRTIPAGGISWYNPKDGSCGEYRNELIEAPVRSLVAAADRTKICYGSNGGKIFVFDVATKTLERTITINSGVSQWADVVMAEASGPEVMCVIVDGSGSSNKIASVNILTGDTVWLQSIPVTGFAFGYNGTGQRMERRLVWGPDNYIWLFMGNTLYRVDSRGRFYAVTDCGGYGMIAFGNYKDLLLYNLNNSNSLKVIYDMFVAVE